MLPELIRFFWRDFGTSKREVIEMIGRIVGGNIGEDMQSLARERQISVEFTSFCWDGGYLFYK